MLISNGEDQISLPLENGGESIDSFPLGPNPDSIDEQPPSPSPESPLVPTSYTDINVVPEHEEDQLEQRVSNLEGEIVDLRLKQRSLDEKRREALNKLLDIKGCIRVFCRVRPFLSIDKRRIHQPISIESEKIVVRSGGSRKEFGFDKVFPQEASQVDVFVEVEPILRSALDGRNVCILAYGQTGTGKTYTMDGTNYSPGIVPRVLEELFLQASLGIYLHQNRPAESLLYQDDLKGSVEIEGLTEVQISNFAKASWWYTKGRRVRSTSWTNVNEASSRSHCLTRITISRLGNALGGKAEVSKLWMVDLGGSERLLKTGATGQTLDEGRAINLSLSALGDVIAALRRKKGHVPYRNSKLTQILRDSLGDGSKVLMLVHISPYEEDVGETTCSFTFAKRARAVEFNREFAEEAKKQKEKRIAELEEEMMEAEEECQKVRNQIQKAEFLLRENKKLFSTSYQLLEDEGETPLRANGYLNKVLTPEKAIRRDVANFLPRFMGPTVASRQRQNAAESEINGRAGARSLRSGTRSAIQISASHQSVSYSEPRLKALLRNSNKKSRYGETNPSLGESGKCNGSDSTPSAIPQAKILTSSDPNMNVTLGRHRRRMSNLM